MSRIPTPGALGKVTLFRSLTSEHLSRLSGLLRCNTFPAGTNFLTAEQPGEAAYIILSGTIKIEIGDVILAFRGAGEVVGEMSLVDSHGRSANAVTMDQCETCWIDRATFTGIEDGSEKAGALSDLALVQAGIVNEE